MDSRERILRALYGEEPDTVPLFEIEINVPIVRQILGRTPRDALDFYEIYSSCGLDGINFWDNFRPVKPLDEKSFIDDWARIWSVEENEVTYYVRGTIDSEEDFENFSPPDPFDYDRLDRLRKVIKNNKYRLAVVGGIHDAFEIPSQMRGVNNFLIDLYKNPGFARRIIEASVNYNIELAKAMIDLGVDALISGDDYAYKHGPFMSVKLFREFIAPYLKKIVDEVHRRGVPFIKHCDGYIWPILDDIVNTGIDALHPIEPQAGMSVREVKEKYGDRLCVMGNVDVTNVLPLGTVEDTVKDVRRCIEEGANGGGYILSSSNSIHNAVKVENFKTMIRATKKYGKYSRI
ncbi:MAG: uroporphyrinogen decarboxylase family protein [Candidatus Freyarchaeota archaeon]